MKRKLELVRAERHAKTRARIKTLTADRLKRDAEQARLVIRDLREIAAGYLRSISFTEIRKESE